MFVGFWDGDYVNQLPYVWYYVGVMSRRKSCLVDNGVFLIIEKQTVSFHGAVSFKRCSTSSKSDMVNS